MHYTNGANIYSNADLTITTGVGKQYPFGSTFTPRTWNGRIHYVTPQGTGIRALGCGFDNSFNDDFSTDTGRWTYWGSASRIGTSYVELTPALNSQTGQIWFDQTITSGMTVEFDYWIGDLGGGGADGMAFMFYKDPTYAPVGGGSMGFDLSNGYGIELDHWPNGGDPSAEHIGLIEDNTANHLASSNENIDNSAWHHARVVVGTDTVTVYHDDMGTAIFSWTGVLDTTFGGFGFTAATGGANSRQLVDNVEIQWGPPHVNLIHNNLITNHNTGVQLQSAQGNVIYFNNFIDNTVHATDDNADPMNLWQHGYPTGGNYWSDYAGVDVNNGVSPQIIPGSDGFGDTPYIIDGDSWDRYPFMDPVTPGYTPWSSPTPIIIVNNEDPTPVSEAEEEVEVTEPTEIPISIPDISDPEPETIEVPLTEEVLAEPDTDVSEVEELIPSSVEDDPTEESVETESTKPAVKNSTWTWTLFPVFFFIILVPSTYRYKKKRR
jgi:hypothetical protein